MRRVAASAAVATVAFVVAVVVLHDDARRGCVSEGTGDAAYAAALEPPVGTGSGPRTLVVTEDGRPLSGGTVCLTATMAGMPAMSAAGRARPVAPGRYRLSIELPMPGRWEGTVLVRRRGGRTVGIPVSFQVVRAGAT